MADTEAQPVRERPGVRARLRSAVGVVVTLLAYLLMWAALVAPDRLQRLDLLTFLRLPIEGLVLVAFGLFLSRRPRRVAAAAFGLLVGLLLAIKVLNMGFYEGLDRPFDPVQDWGGFKPALGVLRDSVGIRWANTLALGFVILLAVLVVLLTLAAVRVAESVARKPQSFSWGLPAGAVAWMALAASSLSLTPGEPLASSSSAVLAADEVVLVRDTIQDQRRFDAAVKTPDPAAATPPADLLRALRGKDVVIAFVESYGQVAVQGTPFSRGVDRVLRAGTAHLRAAGYQSRSAFLTSPTFGGISWLAHSTLQSGLWVDSQGRYDSLLRSNRFTLTRAFHRAGWRTVSDIPSDAQPWPEGKAFYRLDKLYNAENVGYQGPRFSYARIPDEYTLSAFQRRELAPGHAPVMAEIDLVSSHTPWTPLPHLVPWNQVGDGSVYEGMPREGLRPDDVWPDADHVQALYGQSIQYSLRSLVQFATHVDDDNLVLIVMGDHQPATIVSGTDASHNVPITIVARDPSVMNSIASWRWNSGLLPRPHAPVWRMDQFRDRFLAAYQGETSPSAP